MHAHKLHTSRPQSASPTAEAATAPRPSANGCQVFRRCLWLAGQDEAKRLQKFWTPGQELAAKRVRVACGHVCVCAQSFACVHNLCRAHKYLLGNVIIHACTFNGVVVVVVVVATSVFNNVFMGLRHMCAMWTSYDFVSVAVCVCAKLFKDFALFDQMRKRFPNRIWLISESCSTLTAISWA